MTTTERKEQLEFGAFLLAAKVTHAYPRTMMFRDWMLSLGVVTEDEGCALMRDADAIRALGLAVEQVAKLDPGIADEVLSWDREVYGADIRRIVALGADATAERVLAIMVEEDLVRDQYTTEAQTVEAIHRNVLKTLNGGETGIRETN